MNEPRKVNPRIQAFIDLTHRSARYPGCGVQNPAFVEEGLVYSTLGLSGEAGEFADKIKKALRDSKNALSPEARTNLLLELGDVLHYVTRAAHHLGSDLEEVMQMNQDKIEARIVANTIHGKGDHR